MKNQPIALLIALLAAVALLAAACGGSDGSADTAPIIIVESPTDNTDTDIPAGEDTGPDTAAEDASDEEVALAFAQCMRDEGVDFPDPIVNADGSVDFSGVDRDGDSASFDSALEACGELLEGSSFLPSDDDVTEIEDGLLAAAECLRDNGIDVPDPEINTEGGARGPFGPDFDPDDPATATAIDACQDLFAGLGR